MKPIHALRSTLLTLLTFLAIHAFADVGITDLGITNSIANNATTSANVGSAVALTKTDTAALEFSFKGDQAGTGAITITFARSLDGVTYETTPRFTWATAANGTTAVVAYTNLSSTVIGPAAYLKVISIANADASLTATNASLRVIRKTLKPSP